MLSVEDGLRLEMTLDVMVYFENQIKREDLGINVPCMVRRAYISIVLGLINEISVLMHHPIFDQQIVGKGLLGSKRSGYM